MPEDTTWHIIPICVRARGGPNGFITRLHATGGLKLLLGNLSNLDPNVEFFFPEWWFPNDPISNPDGKPRDGWHLEWAGGPIPEDLGEGLIVKEE